MIFLPDLLYRSVVDVSSELSSRLGLIAVDGLEGEYSGLGERGGHLMGERERARAKGLGERDTGTRDDCRLIGEGERERDCIEGLGERERWLREPLRCFLACLSRDGDLLR